VGSPRVSRREALAAGAAAWAALAFSRTAVARRRAPWTGGLDFSKLGAGEGWPGWTCPGVANLRRSGGLGLLEAGSDVFPYDPRPVAFAVDRRFRDGEITARVRSGGAGTGVVLRRTGPRAYYAAVYNDEQHALVLLRRSAAGVHELGRTPAVAHGRLTLSLAAKGSHPTVLTATLTLAAGPPIRVSAHDSTRALQRAGDPGVLATARTLFPSKPEPGPAAGLGNLHLLPYGVQEGEAVIRSPGGKQLLAKIRERSTAELEAIELRASGRPGRTQASVIAASSGRPRGHGATLRVATDVPARVEIEIAHNRRFTGSRRSAVGRTNSYEAVIANVSHLRAGRRVHWRARLHRHGRVSVGPGRSFRVLPRAGSRAPAAIAIGACAAQFGEIFDHLAARRPDAFVWQGDLNYPDTAGPLAQTLSGYAGIWRDFLANPRMGPILERSLFAAQRDDHDYGVQDANSTNLVPWGLAPWHGLMDRRTFYRFSAGLAELWVLDQRLHKTDPDAPDTTHKSLLGAAQRRWLMKTLAASRAPFKVICSPCTLAPLPANGRDGSWATGFTAERDLLLGHIRRHVSGRTLFVTGDTHWTMVYDHGGLFEARPCPLDIPTPNDITLTSPNAAEDARKQPGVAYADDAHGHFAMVRVSGHRGVGRLDLSLVRDDGATPFHKRFEQRI
jgi:hypothetical protein